MAVSAAIAAVGLGIAIYGEVKKSQAEKAAKNNLANRPTYTPLPEDDSQLNLAESNASQGMDPTSRQALLNNSQANTAANINAIQRNGGDANAIGNAEGQEQTGLNNLSIYDDQTRQSHMNTLMATYQQYDAKRNANNDKLFQVNQYAPWADKQQLYGQQITGANQTMNSGLGIAAKGASGLKAGTPTQDPTGGMVGTDTQSGWNGQGASWAPGYGPSASDGSIAPQGMSNPSPNNIDMGSQSSQIYSAAWGSNDGSSFGMAPYYSASGN